MKIVPIWMLALALFLVDSVVQAEETGSLSFGVSRMDVASHFKTAGTHQFSLLQGSNILRCVSHSFGEPFIRYYFLFKNERLIALLDTEPFFADAFETKPNPNPKYAGTQISVRKPWRAEDFMANITEAKSLSPHQMSEQIKTRLERAKGQTKEYNVLPAFVMLAPLIIPDMIARNAKHEAWLREYDPLKVELGARRTSVATTYGKPQFVVQHDRSGRETHAYGPSELLWRDKTRVYLGPLNKRFWVAVVYENDVAVQVLSNDLFNDDNIVKLENEVKQ